MKHDNIDTGTLKRRVINMPPDVQFLILAEPNTMTYEEFAAKNSLYARLLDIKNG